MLRSPPEHLANRKVKVLVDGVNQEVPYTVRRRPSLHTPRNLPLRARAARRPQPSPEGHAAGRVQGE